MLILYDDTRAAPQPIRQIIGVERFADLLRQRRRMGDIIEQIVSGGGGHRFLRISDEPERRAAIDLIERGAAGERVFRLPSCLAPARLDRFAHTLQKLPYALDRTIFGGRFDDEAAVLVERDDALSLLHLGDGAERRSFFAHLAGKSVEIANDMELVDLRGVDQFLAFMTGATETRHFNQTSTQGGVLRKASSDRAKIRGEYRYFHVIPEPMKRFMLPTFDYCDDGDTASYAMERMSVPDAAIQMVHFAFDQRSFATLLDAFFGFIESRLQRPCGVSAVREVAQRDILGKMQRRLDTFLASEPGRKVDAILRANTPVGGIEGLRTRATVLIERAIAADPSTALAVGHGDPCLSNILFHRDIALFRLIDPRGAETLDDAFMHPLYDLAKFSHSVLGSYDFINNGLFECQIDADLQLDLRLEGGGVPRFARDAFCARLAQAGLPLAVVRAYEVSLFLSMLPLHLDNPRKLPAFALTAAAIMDELEQSR